MSFIKWAFDAMPSLSDIILGACYIAWAIMITSALTYYFLITLSN